MSEKKVLMLGGVITLVVLIGGIALVNSRPTESQVLSPIGADVVEANPTEYDLGEVPMKDGEVTREYRIKNTTDKPLKIKKIVTSCMCTRAKVAIGERESRLFGMEGHGDRNPPVNMELPAGQEALVTAVFDPAAHGPSGVGPFDRVVTLTFSDPAGVVELKFKGVVI